MTLRRDRPYWLLVAGCFAWLGLVFFTAYARARGVSGSDLVHACFGSICHQIPERSFHLFGVALPVCHRCLGLYTGLTVGLLALPSLPWLRHWLLETPRRVLFFFLPMAIDVFLIPNTYLTRYLTGFIAAFPVALLMWAAVNQLFHRSTYPSQGGEQYDQRFTG